MLGPDDLREHITDTYFALRRGLVVLSVLLSFVLLGLGAYWHVSWPSLSHYDANGTAGTRDWLVGTLFTTGALLYNYKGFSTLENVAPEKLAAAGRAQRTPARRITPAP